MPYFGDLLSDLRLFLHGVGDRDLAERLLWEHGMNPDFRRDLEPEVVEIMAGTGALVHYKPSHCPVCGAHPSECCDAGLHS